MDWWHTIELPDGTLTPGRVDYRGEKGARFLLPADLTGKSVLDFGTWDGYWAIEAKKRGAAKVVASDRWRPPLLTAQKTLGAYGIPYACSEDLDFPIPPMGQFDVVLFYGILYHLKNPYMGLWNAAWCCKPGGTVIVETAVNEGKLATCPIILPPLLWVIDEIHHDDPTNYFMPNIPGVLQLCRMAGLWPTDQIALEETRFTVVCTKGD